MGVDKEIVAEVFQSSLLEEEVQTPYLVFRNNLTATEADASSIASQIFADLAKLPVSLPGTKPEVVRKFPTAFVSEEDISQVNGCYI